MVQSFAAIMEVHIIWLEMEQKKVAHFLQLFSIITIPFDKQKQLELVFFFVSVNIFLFSLIFKYWHRIAGKLTT